MDSSSQKDETILITGISGFVASWVAHAFLEAGYNVRGTVRSEKSIDGIKKVHAKHAERLSFIVVPDMTATDGFKDAVKGQRRRLIEAVNQRSLNVLKAAAHEGPTVRRFVLTASFASNLDLSKGIRPGFTYNETAWNPATYEEAKASDSGAFTYCAAQALAERAAWDWMDDNKPSFSFVTMCLPWIFGPRLGGVQSLDHLNESTDVTWKLVNGSLKTVPDPDFARFRNVRDIAAAHLRGHEVEEAAGQRCIVGSSFEYQTAVDSLRMDFPQIRDRIPKGTRGQPPETYAIDNSKVQRVLGLSSFR